MKTLMFIIVVTIAFTTQACTQQSNDVQAPKGVLTAFNQKFPNAKKMGWEMENETEWEAEFKLNGKNYSANFTNEGVWKETEYVIKISEIPSAVKQTLDAEFGGYEIEESEVSETTDGKVYEFELQKGETDMEVTISSDGKVVKKELSEENEEEDND